MDLLKFLLLVNATVVLKFEPIHDELFEYDLDSKCSFAVTSSGECPSTPSCGHIGRAVRRSVTRNFLTADDHYCIYVDKAVPASLSRCSAEALPKFETISSKFPMPGSRITMAGFFTIDKILRYCGGFGEVLLCNSESNQDTNASRYFPQSSPSFMLVDRLHDDFSLVERPTSKAFLGVVKARATAAKGFWDVIAYGPPEVSRKYLVRVRDINLIWYDDIDESYHEFHAMYKSGIKYGECPKGVNLVTEDTKSYCTDYTYSYPIFGSQDFHRIHDDLYRAVRRRGKPVIGQLHERIAYVARSIYHSFYGVELEGIVDVQLLLFNGRPVLMSTLCGEILFGFGSAYRGILPSGIGCDERGCTYSGPAIGSLKKKCKASMVSIRPTEFTTSLIIPKVFIGKDMGSRNLIASIPISLNGDKVTVYDVYEVGKFYTFTTRIFRLKTASLSLVQAKLEWYNAAMMFFGEHVIKTILSTIGEVLFGVLGFLFDFLVDFGGCCFSELLACCLDMIVILFCIFPCYSHLTLLVGFLVNAYIRLVLRSSCCFVFQQVIVDQFND
nr:P62 protein [Solanum violifolium ringspot virus]